ncbi:MAG: fibronectin type III domain-containing protein, partial [Treponema sp.]|nr:fibronectin type III domain-containing protein [Treponema sp.]
REKAEECRYSAAEAYSLAGQYEEAAALYAVLGDYKDSEEKAAQSRTLAAEEGESSKLGLRKEEATSTSLTLKWDNEKGLGTFTVSYMPSGIASQAVTDTQSEAGITIEGLLPNTQYTVSVASPEMSEWGNNLCMRMKPVSFVGTMWKPTRSWTVLLPGVSFGTDRNLFLTMNLTC